MCFHGKWKLEHWKILVKYLYSILVQDTARSEKFKKHSVMGRILYVNFTLHPTLLRGYSFHLRFSFDSRILLFSQHHLLKTGLPNLLLAKLVDFVEISWTYFDVSYRKEDSFQPGKLFLRFTPVLEFIRLKLMKRIHPKLHRSQIQRSGKLTLLTFVCPELTWKSQARNDMPRINNNAAFLQHYAGSKGVSVALTVGLLPLRICLLFLSFRHPYFFEYFNEAWPRSILLVLYWPKTIFGLIYKFYKTTIRLRNDYKTSR